MRIASVRLIYSFWKISLYLINSIVNSFRSGTILICQRTLVEKINTLMITVDSLKKSLIIEKIITLSSPAQRVEGAIATGTLCVRVQRRVIMRFCFLYKLFSFNFGFQFVHFSSVNQYVVKNYVSLMKTFYNKILCNRQ